MTYVSNDPSWWPQINWYILLGYWTVVAGVVVVYDWVLTLGQEIELIWRQRWSLMTVLYLTIRYMGILYSVVNVLKTMPSVSLTDAGCTITYSAVSWINTALTAMLGVIMIARLHAMYKGSRTMLMILVIIFLAVNITCGVMSAMALNDTVAEEFILSGIYMCGYGNDGNEQLLFSMVWMLNTVWEVLALCLSVWVAVKNIRGMRRLGLSTGLTIGDCFRVLIQSHVLYFASFVGVSCLQLAFLSPAISNLNPVGILILSGALQVLSVVQMFVLGPCLILSIREYNAKLVAYSDTETSMNSVVFQERVHVSTSSTV